jgi:ligand-binding sensor domain-containing protein/signal transduction histidine kinase/DNA-binding response OmpR family regulator
MRLNILVFLLIICLSPLINVKGESIEFEKEKSQLSLSRISITTIVQDDHGFIWLGTEYGLLRFDGYKYISFYANEEDQQSLPSNIIKRIIKSRDGNIWIGTDKGLAYIDKEKGIIIRPRFCNILNNLQINTICEDKENNLWLGTNEGVFVINQQLEKIRKIFIKLNDQNNFNVNFIDCDLNGNIWIGSNFGFCSISRIKPQKLFSLTQIKGNMFYEKNRLGFFKIDYQNRLWFNSENKNYLYKIDNTQKLSSKIINSTDIDGKCILIQKNKILVGSRWSGITEFDCDRKGNVNYLAQIFLNPNSTSDMSNTVNAIFEDASGNIWAGTKAGLFVKRKKTPQAFHSIKANEQNLSELSHNAISSICQSKAGEIWLGTSNGLNKFTLENGKIPKKIIFKRYSPLNQEMKSASNDLAVQCIVEDRSNQIWVGTKQGIIYFDPQKEKFYRKEGTDQYINQNNFALPKTLYCDANYNVWIGFSNGGLVFYNLEKKVFYQIRYFSKSDVWAIAKDYQGNMWIGTRNGLFQFKSNLLLSQIDSNTKAYKHKIDDDQSISSSWITALQIDKTGTLWIGTSEGLCKYNSSTDKFDRINLGVGNHRPYISGLVEDKKSRMWISTTSGVFRMSDSKNVEFFELSEGNFSSINYTFGNCLTNYGEILLGGASGLIHFNSDEIVPDSTKQLIQFCNISTPNQLINNNIININNDDELTLSYKDQQFSISFSTLFYSSPETIKYSYRIKELGNDWIYLDAENTVTFSNLPAGKYTLEVRSTTPSGFWQNESRKLKINILPPWWKTTWAYLIYMLILSLCIIFILNWFRERQKLMQINELNHYKLVFYTNLLHSFKTPLSLMQAPLNNLILNHKKMKNEETEEMLNFLQRNTKRLTHTVLQLLEFRKIDRGKLSLHLTKSDIFVLLNDVFTSFSKLAESKGIEFTFESSLFSQFLIFDFEKIETVLFNLLSNAFKFTNKGGNIKLSLNLSQQNNELIISVSDTGIGIAPENQEKIFERFWQVYNDNPLLIQGTGIGLSLAKDFIEAHKGTIKVESELSKGSTFSFSLLLDENHFGSIPIFQNDEGKVKKAEYVEHYVEIENEISLHEIEDSETEKQYSTIYVVDDNKEVLNFLYVTLKKDYHVTLFETPDKCLEEIALQQPNLIITDVMINGQALGFDLCKKIKKDPDLNHILVIILSALPDEKVKLNSYENGADAFIEKPFDVNLLLVRIEHLLQNQEIVRDKLQREIISNPQNIRAISFNNKFLSEVMSVIEENMDDEHFTLEDFARSMKVSRSILNSKMLSLTQQTPIEFMRNIRLKRAAQLLTLNAYSVSEVSYKVGISDPRYFSTIFKKQYGVSPMQYVREHINSDRNQN